MVMARMDLLQSQQVRQRQAAEEGMLYGGTPAPSRRREVGLECGRGGLETRRQYFLPGRRCRRLKETGCLAAGGKPSPPEHAIDEQRPRQRTQQPREWPAPKSSANHG